jgi:hypothetical protein
MAAVDDALMAVVLAVAYLLDIVPLDHLNVQLYFLQHCKYNTNLALLPIRVSVDQLVEENSVDHSIQ